MIGKILNDRYELVEKIGTGGMAIVYRAEDSLLSREVAVKILQPQYADNSKAVKRFRHEAKSVASLNHPNIINIFDIGQDDELEYIVMEYITGQDLKEKIKEEGSFSPVKAVNMVMEVCQALIKAHRNNIIHCDVKPHNILLDSDERVKVTDFGIAQAVTDATMAQTESIVGSAHYLSPEQARGDKVTTKSDLYSLGILLYELLTGELPFEGDNSVSVALKHVKEEPPSPAKYKNDLPPKLIKIIMKSLAKKPDERYNSANELLRDLKEVAENLAGAEISNQETMVISKNKLANRETKSTSDTKGSETKAQEDSVSNQDDKQTTTVNLKNKKEKSGLKIAAIVVGIIIALLGISYYLYLDYVTVPNVEVPNLVEQSLDSAEETLQKKGLQLEVYYKTYSSKISKNHIVSQSPKAGEVVKKNRAISVVVSQGSDMSVVPDFKGVPLRKAKVELDKNDLLLGEVEEKYSSEFDAGEVISQTPPKEKKVEAKTKVDLVVSKGVEPQRLKVPNVVGLKREDAIEEIRSANLILGQVSTRKSLNYFEGRVIAQQPASGDEIAEGSTIQLIISSGIRNPYNSEVRKSNVNIEVTPGQQKEVKIVVQDDNGQRIMYQQLHQPGDKIYKDVITVGPAVIKVYFDDKLVSEKTIR
ncbi:MAG: Stk1 family PASTA domain-containing Ser/Thr kinase [Bacillota bacterium]